MAAGSDPGKHTSASSAEMAAASTSGTVMIVTMACIGLICGIFIVLTYQSTYSAIQENKARFLEKAIFDVLPGAVEQVTFVYSDDSLRPIRKDEEAAVRYYAGYDKNKKLTGIAVEAEGPGFQDLLRIIYGYSPACRCIVGMQVLESRETPGLGDKIETDANFRANFIALDVSLSLDNNKIANPVVLVKPRQKTESWQIEAISGATISSRAIANMLRANTALSVPFIEAHLDTFRDTNR